jgi:PemK-like, MazF-like toxin of type II toxin-antitoxin system
MQLAPERGDVVWLEFDSQAGHKQARRRPALVLSPRRIAAAGRDVLQRAERSQDGPFASESSRRPRRRLTRSQTSGSSLAFMTSTATSQPSAPQCKMVSSLLPRKAEQRRDGEYPHPGYPTRCRSPRRRAHTALVRMARARPTRETRRVVPPGYDRRRRRRTAVGVEAHTLRRRTRGGGEGHDRLFLIDSDAE